MSEGVALSASLLCLIHCLALPSLLLLLPGLLGLAADSHAIHLAALGVAFPAALIAFARGYRQHGAALPVILGSAGLVCLAGALLPALAEAETTMTVAGSLLLVTGHAINWRRRRCARRHG